MYNSYFVTFGSFVNFVILVFYASQPPAQDKRQGFTDIGTQHCSEQVRFRMCFTSGPVKVSLCRSPDSPERGTSRFLHQLSPCIALSQYGLEWARDSPRRGKPSVLHALAPSSAPSQCDLECAPKVTPWRGHSAGPRLAEKRNTSFSTTIGPQHCSEPV